MGGAKNGVWIAQPRTTTRLPTAFCITQTIQNTRGENRKVYATHFDWQGVDGLMFANFLI